MGRQSVPDPVELDGADAPLRAAGPGLLAKARPLRGSDRVLACRFCYDICSPKRGDIVVFNTPPRAALALRHRRRLREAPDRAARARSGRRRTATSTSTARSSNEPYIKPQYRDDTSRSSPQRIPAGAVLHHGRQPRRLVRLAQVWGTVPREQPDREGGRDLLAAVAHLDPVGRPPSLPSTPSGAFGPERTSWHRLHEHDHPGTRAPQLREVPRFKAGDTVRVHFRVIEGTRAADPGVRGDRDQAPGRRRARDLHRAQELLRRRGRADIPAALAEDRQDRRRARSATSTARSSTTCAARSARRLASASSDRRPHQEVLELEPRDSAQQSRAIGVR